MSRLEELIQQYCPNGVEYKKLGDIATLTRGGNFQKKDFTDSGVPCIHYGQIYTHYGIHTTLYQSNCCRFNNGIATLAAVIYTVFLIYNNACKAGTTIERTNSYACYAVGYCNAFEAGAN